MYASLRKFWLLGLIALIVAAFAVACGDDDDEDGDDGDTTPAATEPAETPSGDGTPSGGDIDISGVPELQDGTLTIGSDIAYPPIEFIDEATGDPAGLDIDLANAIGEVLGVEVEFQNAVFDGLIQELVTERYDIIMSAMSVNPERDEQVDFIEYFNAGTGIIIEAGNPDGIETAEDLCGKNVSVQQGTIQVDLLEALNEQCEDDINILQFQTDPEAVQALLAGQADAELADYPVAGYSASQNEGEIELVPTNIDPGPYGIAMRPDSDELEEVLQQALDQIIEDGTYDEILEKWNLAAGSIEEEL